LDVTDTRSKSKDREIAEGVFFAGACECKFVARSRSSGGEEEEEGKNQSSRKAIHWDKELSIRGSRGLSSDHQQKCAMLLSSSFGMTEHMHAFAPQERALTYLFEINHEVEILKVLPKKGED